jgi:4-cresol dehydrogenase (hydroxylating)
MLLADVFKIPFGEDTGHLDLSPIGPLSGDEVLRAVTLMRTLYARHGYPYLAGLLLSPRSVIHVSSTFFDPNDEAQTRAVYASYEEMVVELTKAGYPLYRTNIHHMDLVADQFDFNDHALRRVNETLKDALDPNGILQAGKQGIWPAAARGVG